MALKTNKGLSIKDVCIWKRGGLSSRDKREEVGFLDADVHPF